MPAPPDFLLIHLLSLIPPHGGLALDAGCGSGRNIPSLEGAGYRVVALDQASGGSVRADICQLPYPPSVFDLVVCDSVLDASSDPTDCAVSELKRVAKPGGHLLIVVAAAEGSDPGITFTKDTVLGWVADLMVVELLYVRVDHPPAVGVRAQWALLARRW